MAPYDSDSSSDEDNDYTTTDVILGYAAEESSGDEISHVGGHPTWLDTNTKPPASLAKCKVCSGYMTLLLQLNADLLQHFPNDQRRLQVWACRKKSCTRKPGSIRAFREVKKPQTSRQAGTSEPAKPTKGPSVDLGNALFGGKAPPTSGSANPFSTDSNAAPMAANPFNSSASSSSPISNSPQPTAKEKQPLIESFAEKVRIGVSPDSAQTASEKWPEIDKFPPPYPFYYLDAFPEELDPTPNVGEKSVAESSKTKYDIEDTSSSALDKDNFESSLDKTFQKFSDIVAQNPEQVLRYEFKGQPLLYSGSDGVASRFIVPHGKAGAVKGIPRCEKCGSQRVFEMQLTPYLIYEIEKDEAVDIDSGMEWGAILVGTCINNCGEEGAVSFREEWVGVQWEERVTRK